MTPSNPSNSQPFIYRILDSLGIPHQVVPVDHSHNYIAGQSVSLIIGGTEIELEGSDIPNVIRALNTDPDSSPTEGSDHLIKSGGVFSALANKLSKLTSFTTGNFVKVKADGTLEDSGKNASDFAEASHTHAEIDAGEATVEVTGGGEVIMTGETVTFAIENQSGVTVDESNIANLSRALQTPDSTPTANSDKLIKSGGVKAALDAKADIRDVGIDVFTKGDVDEKIDVAVDLGTHTIQHYILHNYLDNTVHIDDFFDDPSDNGNMYWISKPSVPMDGAAIVTIYKEYTGNINNYYVVLDGIYTI